MTDDNLWESVLSVHHMGETWVTRPGAGACPAESSCWSQCHQHLLIGLQKHLQQWRAQSGPTSHDAGREDARPGSLKIGVIPSVLDRHRLPHDPQEVYHGFQRDFLKGNSPELSIEGKANVSHK